MGRPKKVKTETPNITENIVMSEQNKSIVTEPLAKVIADAVNPGAITVLPNVCTIFIENQYNVYFNAKRCCVEENKIQSELRRLGISINKVIRIYIEREYVAEKCKLKTTATVFYK
jgi:hypothetical protein